jgi:hypothetical protein
LIGGIRKDLIVLTADKDARLGITQLLHRSPEIDVRKISFECLAHPKHDPGVYGGAHEFLRPFLRDYEYALVVLDLEGCGQEARGRVAVEQMIEHRLMANGWKERCAAVVIAPELECWVWDANLEVSRILNRPAADVRQWLLKKNYTQPGAAAKPHRPKEAFEAALRAANLKKSSSIYQDFANVATTRGCADEAFYKFWRTLRSWFPRPSQA